MAVVTIPYSFVPNTTIISAQVNADFSAIATYLNTGTGSFSTSGYIVLPGGIYVQWANQAGVNADGSGATAVSFPIAFPTGVFTVVPSINNAYQSNAWELTCHWDTATTTGFNINVAGGPSGKTVTVSYFAVGN